MAHYCECRRRIVVRSSARHARAGWIYRPGHDLCRKCWRSLIEKQAKRNVGLVRANSFKLGFQPKPGARELSLALSVLAYKIGEREARWN